LNYYFIAISGFGSDQNVGIRIHNTGFKGKTNQVFPCDSAKIPSFRGKPLQQQQKQVFASETVHHHRNVRFIVLTLKFDMQKSS
jgi:hypothetical protein